MADLETCNKILTFLANQEGVTVEQFTDQKLAEIAENQKLHDDANVVGLTFEEREATASACLEGALHIRIGNIPNVIWKRLVEEECDSVDPDVPGVFKNCIQKLPVAEALYERLKSSYEVPLGPLNPGMILGEMYHILMLLDIYWD